MTEILRPLLIMLFIMQILVSLGFELAHDEAYYWLYSKNLDWGYFDHPPMVGIIIRLFSFLPHAEGSVRFGFIVMQFLTLLCLFGMTLPRHRFMVTILFFAFPLASVAGLLALPDMPLVFMGALYCLFLKKFLEKDDFKNALILGVVIALLLYSKYHGILLVFFTLLALPKLFLNKKFYLIAAVALLLFIPHILWQYQHDFSTLRYHFIERPSSQFNIFRLAEYLGIQIVLAGALAGPVVWWSAYRTESSSAFLRAMKFIAFGTIVFFLISSFSKKIEANWTIFLVVPLVVLSVQSPLWEKPLFKNFLYGSFALVILARLILIFDPETLNIRRLGEFHGWKAWSKEVEKRCQDGGSIMANSYQYASKLSFYLNRNIHSLNYHSRKNQFDYWRFDLEKPIDKVCYLTDKAEFSGEGIRTPEGKQIKIVKGIDYPELLKRKGP